MDYSDLLDRSMDELRIKTAAHDRLWKLGDAAWSIENFYYVDEDEKFPML